MSKVYYKHDSAKIKKLARITALGIFICGIITAGYVFLPIILYQILLAPAFAEQNVAAPIPKTTIVSPQNFATLLATADVPIIGKDYNNAQNWFPGYTFGNSHPKILSYTLSIPKIHIENAMVTTTDNDLSKHLVNIGGTAVPPDKGNAVIFGHSTLPWLFDPKNYHTIFANAHTLKVGDTIIVNVNNTAYNYTIFSTTVVSPDETSELAQSYDASYLTIVTCTPPGTTWKRLIIRAKQT